MRRSVLAMTVVATLGLGLGLFFGRLPRLAAGQGSSAPEPWVYEETVFSSDANLSRPEFCVLNDRAYVTFRETLPGARPRVPEPRIVLKVFDIAEDGGWIDRTAERFGTEQHILYDRDDPQHVGDFTDHQLLCTADAFYLVFEAGFQENGQRTVHTVVRRYSADWALERQVTLLEASQGSPREGVVQPYKTDDPGAALLNGVLYVWVVRLSNGLGTPANGFALYGLDPLTLEATVDDGASGPLVFENPLQAPFAGVMDFLDGEYRLLTNPRDSGGSPYDQDGLVEYRYDAGWNFLGQVVAEHPFGENRPAYATGRVRYGPTEEYEAWGFTVTPPEAGQEKGAIGEAWLRLSGPGGDTYLLVSDLDDTRHTEIAVYGDKAYVAYFHVTEPRAVTIRRYAIPTASVGALSPTSPASLRTQAVRGRADASTKTPQVRYVPGSSRKVCQLTGQFDREQGEPTINRTESRFGLVGTDLGASFEHEGKLYLFFGDTIGTRGERGGHSREGRGNDSVAFTEDFNPEDCLALQFVTGPDGRFRSPEVPGVSLLGFEVPTGGFSANGAMYVFFTTDHSEQRVMGRSILARSRDGAQSFEFVYTVSRDKFINIAPVVVDNAETLGLPEDEGEGVLLWGSGWYRRSDPYLAYIPLGQVEDRGALHYFAGLDSAGLPHWSASESEAIALFAHPCIGELSVAWNPFIEKWLMLYNCGNPRGIVFRVSEEPWGPWSEAQVLFNPWEDNGYCHFMHVSWESRVCDSVHDSGRENVWGGEYGPYMIPQFFSGDERRTTIYFVMSTWNPYNVVLMRSMLEIAR